MPNIQEISALFSANADGITGEPAPEAKISAPSVDLGVSR